MAEKKTADLLELEAEVVDEGNTLELSKPLASGVNQLVFDFERINGYALIKCEKAAKKEDPTITVQALSLVFQAHVAAAAAKVRYDDILNLNASDFTAACLKAQAFLLNAGK
jgi:hypothetical protein